MTNPTHTPGEWSAEASSDGTFCIYARSRENGTQLLGEFYSEDMGDDLPVQANMHLAASAPELLEALKEARTTISILRTNVLTEIGRCADPSESRWAGVPEQLAKRLASIDAAITKAEG